MLMTKGDEAAQLEVGFKDLLDRHATASEETRLVAYLREQKDRLHKAPADLAKLLGNAGPIKGASAEDSGAFILVSRVMLNLDETITKE